MRYLTFTALAGIASLISCISALPATENTLTTRGEGLDDLFIAIIQGLAKDASNELLQLFGLSDPPPNCCDDADWPCHMNAGIAKNGKAFQVCYNPGTETIYDYDVSAMKCILNLHYTQADKCISVAGSTCANGYTGGIMNGHTNLLTSGYDSANQLTSDQSGALQAAAESMLNVGITYADPSNAAMTLITLSDDKKTVDSEIDFVGHQGIQC